MVCSRFAADAPALLLASGSPRRRQLLLQAGCAVQTVPAHTEEVWRPLPPEQAAQALAVDKYRAAHAAHAARVDPDETRLWVAADTVVVLGERICGKPTSDADAVEMLLALSGRTHQVITGFVVACGAQRQTGACTTTVRMRAFDRAEAAAYVATGEPRDKSGAYAIQGGGTVLCAQLQGSLSNVVGLPVAEVLAAIEALGACKTGA